MTGLLIILLLVLILPFTMKLVERNLEVFLFLMGVASALAGGVFNKELVTRALTDPIKITIAVVIAGLFFKWFKKGIENGVRNIVASVPGKLFIFISVVLLGFISSIITAIIAALLLVLIAGSIRLDRKSQVLFVVISCFSIGLGAALTPIGEPLSTLTVSKLNEDFLYLIQLIGPYVIPAVFSLGIFASFAVKMDRHSLINENREDETYEDIFVRGVKIYLFVMGLTLLGSGFEPLINLYLLDFSSLVLYWINIVSAVLDNATLAAAEISPAMSREAIQAILLGLLVSGGMLIPGNIPNIIAAGKLEITSKEWAKYGLPLGLVIMIIFFIFLLM